MKNIKPYKSLAGLLAVALVILATRLSHCSVYTTILSACGVCLMLALRAGAAPGELCRHVFQVWKNSAIVIAIILVIGFTVGIWMAGGTLPGLLYYVSGFCIPQIAVPMTFLSSAVMAWITGSSYCTISSIGVVMVGISAGYGIPQPLAIGAVVSGAILGNRISPVSDTFNLTTQMCGIDRLRYQRFLFKRTMASAAVVAVIYGIAGSIYLGKGGNTESMQRMQQFIGEHFRVGLVCVLPLVWMVMMAFTRITTLKGLVLGAGFSILVSLFSQEISLEALVKAGIWGYYEYAAQGDVGGILSGGGAVPMMRTSFIILLTGMLGGLFTASRIPQELILWLEPCLKKKRSLMMVTFLASMIVLFISSNQMLAIIILAPELLRIYQKTRNDPYRLAEIFADTTVVACAWIPWGTFCMFVAGTFGADNRFILYTFYSILLPVWALARIIWESGNKAAAG